MTIHPFASDAQLVSFATRLMRNRIETFRKDLRICMTGDANGNHAYFPALMICFGFLDFLSGLHAGKFEKHGLPELQQYIQKYFARSRDYAHVDILYFMFRHKMAHLAYPYLVFDTATKSKLAGPRRRITWTVGIYRGRKPIELIDYKPPRKLVLFATPWPVTYDARMIISLKALSTDILASTRGKSGYLGELRSDAGARWRFAHCMKLYTAY